MRIREVRELKFHWTFFLFPVNPTFFLCIFRSGRSFSFHIGWFVKGSCYANFSDKKFSPTNGRRNNFFRWNLICRAKSPRSYLCLLKREKRPPGWGTAYGEGLPIGKRDKSSCSLSSDREHYTKRAGKARVSEARLSIRLCGFPKALFTKNS